MRILITCFMPFKGREKNGSQVLARYLQTNHQKDEVRVVDLPVRWGAVESVTSTIIENWRPNIILGLGEGADTSIGFETMGRNARKGEDVDGNPPPSEFILDNGDPERSCRFSFRWAQQITLPSPIKISLDAGAYLCNNALYYFIGTGCRLVGFIHIPPQNDVDDASYCDIYGPVLLEILQQNTNVSAE
jgi:pyrrolidone-carboxylate peptidase